MLRIFLYWWCTCADLNSTKLRHNEGEHKIDFRTFPVLFKFKETFVPTLKTSMILLTKLFHGLTKLRSSCTM